MSCHAHRGGEAMHRLIEADGQRWDRDQLKAKMG
jgi:hypothetical protein